MVRTSVSQGVILENHEANVGTEAFFRRDAVRV